MTGYPQTTEDVPALLAYIGKLEAQLDEVRALVGPENESGMISATAIFHTIGTGNQGEPMNNYTPTTEPSRVEKIMDTLAYYQCRETNPKADHPSMGYHAFSEEQRKFLQEKKREAAEEINRWHDSEMRKAKEQAWEEGLLSAGLDPDYTMQIMSTNPYTEES